MRQFTSDFTARIIQVSSTSAGYSTKVDLPYDVTQLCLEAGVKRVLFTVNGKTFRRGVISDGSGGLYIIMAAINKELHLGVGAMVDCSLSPDPDPDQVDLPEELEVLLDQDEAFAAKFKLFTPGKKRTYAHMVDAAKSAEVRIRRALELAEKAKLDIPLNNRGSRKK